MTTGTGQLVDGAPGTEPDAGQPEPVRVAWALVPRVNLLPTEIIERRRFRRTQLVLAVAVAGTLALAGAGTWWSQRGVDSATEELVVAQAAVGSLQQQQARYAVVPEVLGQVDDARAARGRAMAADVLWYRYLADLRSATPSGVRLTGVTVTLSQTGPSGTADVLTPAGWGTVRIDGMAQEYRQVSAWLEALDALGGLSHTTLSTATDSDDALAFSTGAVLDSAALSGRYDPTRDEKAG